MMPSMSGVRLTVFSLLLLRPAAHQSVEVQCSGAESVGKQHPVQGLMERFEAGTGCAARQRGDTETHVVTVGRVTNSPENKVTVLLKPLSPSASPLRTLHLLLSSKLPVSWWLEAERLPPNLPVLVQLSSNSSVQSRGLRLHVHTVHSLPFRPRALHRWALRHYGNLSSLIHTGHGNRVYISLGEDPTLPDVCQLQSMFLSHNYMTSDLQQQEVQGCADVPADGMSPEVHVVKLHSAGSGLCGSLQVEVIVSLVPLVANSKTQKVVLILSSSVPVNWAIVAYGVRGHVSVYSSNSISRPSPPEPGLTLSSTLNSDLSTVADILTWAREIGYSKVTSYTEADLANRFVIRLAGGGTDVVALTNPLVLRPRWAEERRLRQWLNGGSRAGGDRESFTVQCEDGCLSVTVDQHMLQSLSDPVTAVTLRDPTCQAQSNGSHFLLVFPVISCGTEGLLLGQPRGVQYKNMVLLWREQPPQNILALNDADKQSKSPLSIHFSCLAAVSTLQSPAGSDKAAANTPQMALAPRGPEAEGPEGGVSYLLTPRRRPGPSLILKLFVTESYEQGRIGPCVITADHRVYVEISAKGPFIDVVEVTSCVVSPVSDPKKSRFWTVISDRCSSDPSLTLAKEEEDGDGELDEEEMDGRGEREVSLGHKVETGSEKMRRSSSAMGAEEEIQPLRFSFILRPVFNDSMQFLHCSLRLCVSNSTRGEPMKERAKNDCGDGIRIPPLVSTPPRQQCEIRNLSRPMVVTQPMTSLAPKLLRPPPGQRSVSPLAGPNPEHGSSEVQTARLITVVFAAFVMGVTLMGGWCIYYNTGARQASPAECHLTDQTHGVHNICNPALLSDQSSGSSPV